MLKREIERLIKEIEQLKKRGYPTQKKIKVPHYEYNSDVGRATPFGEETISVPMSADEIQPFKKRWELELYSLESELKRAQDELFELEWNKPENVSRREEEALLAEKQEKEKQLREERLEHEERYENSDLNKLVEYLKIARLYDIANMLSELRFAFKKPKTNYINQEIDLQSKERSFYTGNQTTKKEYKEIKKSVIKLSKTATKNAKKYKDLYNLYLAAREIVMDIEKKGISEMSQSELSTALNQYFTQPVGTYFFIDFEKNGSYKESENLGYQYLEFYRDYESKYNEDVRKHKI